MEDYMRRKIKLLLELQSSKSMNLIIEEENREEFLRRWDKQILIVMVFSHIQLFPYKNNPLISYVSSGNI